MTLPRGLCYLSSAHDTDDLDATKAAITAAMARYTEGRAIG